MKRMIPIFGFGALTLLGGTVVLGETQAPPQRPGSRQPQERPEVQPLPPGFPPGAVGGGDVLIFGGEAKLEKKTYIGVMTEPVSPPLRAQLGLAEESGLVAMHVEKDSPAAKADIKEYDVLLKLDDQVLINREQFRTLAQSHKAGDTVKLSILRAGKPMDVTVKLEEHEVRSVMQFQPIGQDRVNQMNEIMKHMQDRKIDDPEMQKLMEQMQRQVNELNDRMKAQQGRFGMQPGGPGGPGRRPGGPGGPGFEGPGGPDGPDGNRPPPRDGNDGPPPGQPGGDDRRPPGGPGGPGDENRPQRGQFRGEARGLLVEPEAGDGAANANVTSSSSYSDDQHTITITNTNGDRHLTAKDKEGKQIFDGPINTPEQRKAIPAEIAEKMKHLDAQTRIRIRVQPGQPGQGGPGEGNRPAPPRDIQ